MRKRLVNGVKEVMLEKRKWERVTTEAGRLVKVKQTRVAVKVRY